MCSEAAPPQRVLLFGDAFGLPQILKAATGTQICGLVAAEIRPQEHEELRRLATAHGLPLLIQPRRNSSAYGAFVDAVSGLAPELILVNSYSMLLPLEVLKIPRCGSINIHAGLLPQYRGSNPTQWALLNDECETDVTMHYMDAEFDTGDIISRRRVPIYLEDTWREIRDRFAAAAEAMLAEQLPKVLMGTNAREPQVEADARYYRRRHAEDGLIDWDSSVLRVYNLVRALVTPHPGAFFHSSGRKIVLPEYRTIPQVVALKYGVGGKMLTAEHVHLAPLEAADVPTVRPWVTEIGLSLPLGVSGIMSPETDSRWLDALNERNDVVVFGVRVGVAQTLVGYGQIHDIDYTGSHYARSGAEVQIHLPGVDATEEHFVVEAVRLLVGFAFSELCLQWACAHVVGPGARPLGVFRKDGSRDAARRSRCPY